MRKNIQKSSELTVAEIQQKVTDDYVAANCKNNQCNTDLRNGRIPLALKGVVGVQRDHTEDYLTAYSKTLMPTQKIDKIVSKY